MRLAMLIAAACLGLTAALAHADGKEGKTYNPQVRPLEATGIDASYSPVPASHETGYYRFGATFTSVESDTPIACEAACNDNNVCQAWSFVHTYGAAPARCELKRAAGRKEENPLAISGIAESLKRDMIGDAVVRPTDEPVPPGQLKGGLSQVEEDLGVEAAAIKAAVDQLAALN